jgi:hypothetical protein
MATYFSIAGDVPTILYAVIIIPKLLNLIINTVFTDFGTKKGYDFYLRYITKVVIYRQFFLSYRNAH